MGTEIHHCGAPGSGIRTKLVNNYLAITSCQMNAEALALAQRFGLNLEKTLEVIHGTTATNGQLKINYATKVLTGDIEPGFQIDLAHKDLSLVLAAANAGRVPMAIAAAARESLSLARAGGWGGRDFSSLLDALCESAGLEPVRFAPGRNSPA
jgi:4-hydroxybutyrate dehydrogenase/sulfolactaldehyde 3-reductase